MSHAEAMAKLAELDKRLESIERWQKEKREEEERRNAPGWRGFASQHNKPKEEEETPHLFLDFLYNNK